MPAAPRASSIFPALRPEGRTPQHRQGKRGSKANVARLRQASFRLQYPDRTLHVVDIENLAGAAIPTLDRVAEIQGQYLTCLRFGVADQVVLATNHLALLNAGLGWPHARYRVRSGKDGADLELLDVLEHENVATRFSHVVIGSGDGGFGQAAASLAARGVRITVVSRWGSLAYELAKTASRVVYLDGPLTVAA